jgi:hypothetical protein
VVLVQHIFKAIRNLAAAASDDPSAPGSRAVPVEFTDKDGKVHYEMVMWAAVQETAEFQKW